MSAPIRPTLPNEFNYNEYINRTLSVRRSDCEEEDLPPAHSLYIEKRRLEVDDVIPIDVTPVLYWGTTILYIISTRICTRNNKGTTW